MSAVPKTAGFGTVNHPVPQATAARARFNPKYLPLAATISLFVAMATLGSVLLLFVMQLPFFVLGCRV